MSGEKLLNGAIVVDKPIGWTSHDVVNKMRRLCAIRKIGHLGTLDPNATGVLPLLVGRATRLAQFFGRNTKCYEGVVHFGYSTDSYDSQGIATSEQVLFTAAPPALEEALEAFRGTLQQVPPPVSAKKVGGVPAYKLARRNQPVELAAVEVQIFALDLLWCAGAEATLRIHCSAGTYVRSIAHELGRAFGCGAHLKSLRRTASGEFDLAGARTLEQLADLAAQGRLDEALIPAASLLKEFPVEAVDEVTTGLIRQGRQFHVSPFRSPREGRFVKAVSPAGDLVAIGEEKLPNIYHPVLVL